MTDNGQGLLDDRRLAEFAYALPRTRWNLGLTQRMGRASFLGRVSYYGAWYDYDSGFARVYDPTGGIDNGFFAGRPVVDIELTLDAGGGATVAIGAQNAFDTYPDESARALSVGERYSGVRALGLQRRLLLRAARVRLGRVRTLTANHLAVWAGLVGDAVAQRSVASDLDYDFEQLALFGEASVVTDRLSPAASPRPRSGHKGTRPARVPPGKREPGE